MLFNSYEFILFFFPLCFSFYYFFYKKRINHVLISLLFFSSVYYSWWNYKYLPLLVFSILINYILGERIQKYREKLVVVLGVSLNLSLLFYYKYSHFIIDQIYSLTSPSPVLPLAISFYTFQQIAYLVDSYKQKIVKSSFKNYALFIAFFPQLIAGPIVHYNEIISQIDNTLKNKKILKNLEIGITIFIIGLSKKVILADSISPFVNQIFDAAEVNMLITPLESWLGAIAYSFQLYFDFSGYSDMAIGLAYCFGIKLPQNFNSPYKAVSIIDFWRRWHITLSNFLRDYLYVPLGGNRNGKFNRYKNLFITMLLGGLWHGAGWTYIIWGMIHGFYLIVNHCFTNQITLLNGKKGQVLSRGLTFFFIVQAWVVFKADSIQGAWHMFKCMYDFNHEWLPHFFGRYIPKINSYLPAYGQYANSGSQWAEACLYLILMSFIIWFLPNSTQWLSNRLIPISSQNTDIGHYQLSLQSKNYYAFAFGFILFIVLLNINQHSEFLYYQF